ncbi:MAG: polysaccharide deacetylase family protein [Methylococcaceae bacterium]|nr:polysaccharide deacetylase family protein [Methylococcaceae bacterium]
MSNPNPWRPPLLIKGSALLHLGAAAVTGLHPETWPWSAGAITANHALLAFSGLWPRCGLLGPNWTCLPPPSTQRGDVAITIDDGPEPEVTPAVLDQLDHHGAKATFFCIGERAKRYPQLCREIVERGHAVENHSMQHRHNFSLLGPGGFARELEQAQETLTAITQVRPLFFRAPAGLRNPMLYPVLNRFDLRLAAWTRRGYDTRDADSQSVQRKLLRGLRGGDILLLHDGNAALTRNGHAVILEVLPSLLDAIAAANLRPVTLRSALE